jgi:cell division transport system ATP-binding protein
MYLFAELNKVGTTIVVATHSERLVQQFTHRQLRIEQGTVRLIPQRSEAA